MIEIIETAEDFEKLRGEWNDLLESSDSNCLFLSWEWLFTWWRHLSGGRSLFVLAVRTGGKLIALAPLILNPARFDLLRPFRTLDFLGSGVVGSDYLDLIIRRGKEEEAVAAIGRYLTERKLVLELRQVRKNSTSILTLAQSLNQRHGWRFVELTTDVCPYIVLSGHTWPSYLATLGSSHRHNFHRRLKRLNKDFEVRFESAAAEEQRRDSLAILIALHDKRWQGRGSSQAFSTAALRSFHEELSRLALRRDWLRLFVLRLNGKPAAALYGFKYGRTFYFHQSGFDPEYARHSLGLVTMGLAIRSAIEEGVDEYDLLHGDESYKFLWARGAREIERLELYPPSAAGLLRKQISRLGRITRKAARTVLPRTVAERIATARRTAVLKEYYAAQPR